MTWTGPRPDLGPGMGPGMGPGPELDNTIKNEYTHYQKKLKMKPSIFDIKANKK